MRPLLVDLENHASLALPLARAMPAELAVLERRSFPDGETYLRYETSLEGRDVAILCTLDRPDGKVLPLLFAARTARELGAASVGLIAPYLCYMRQDRRFHPGEALTSAAFARHLSFEFDWLVTVEPHLHRLKSLSELYSIPARALRVAPQVAGWIGKNIEAPVLIGPDSESEQWVAAIAQAARAPWIVLEKRRHGDRDVEVAVPPMDRWSGRTPVLVDDIVSTGRTMIETIGHSAFAAMQPPVCLAIHGLFAGSAYRELLEAGAARVATSNTVPHESNAIDICEPLAAAILEMMPVR